MKKHYLLLLVIGFMAFGHASAQENYAKAFESAYSKYPGIPAGSLEVLAYVQTRISNVQPITDADHHHGPARYGIFALVENGEGYFKNTLLNVSQQTGTSAEALKKYVPAQINAVAMLMSQWADARKVSSIEDMAAFFKAFSEIPDEGTVNAFAKDQLLYDIYLSLQTGGQGNGVKLASKTFKHERWFNDDSYKILSAPSIIIQGDDISNGQEKYQPGEQRINGDNESSGTAATDYPAAIWVSSPNYSSRSGTAITDIAIHTTQGSYSGAISWFQNPSSQVSAHYVIRSSDGQVTQMVLEANKAWHAGSANPYTVGIEHEGYVDNAAWYTTAMYNSSAAVSIDICNRQGIAKTSCYNGPAHSGVVTLAASIRIKGHQHFPSQSHTDPGINWNWVTYYNLINPAPACVASTVLNESYIGTNSANLNWGAVTGAASYKLEWKASSSGTWTVVNLTNNYSTINGLAATTSYNWRVTTVCSAGGSSAASTTKTFTSQASCYDAYESNNVYTSPTTYPQLNGGYVYAKICSTGDVDFYKITTTGTYNINFLVENLPKNYNIETYTGAGAYLKGGYATGTTSENVVLNNKAAGTYLFRVYGATSADNDALSDYRLKVTTSPPTTSFAEDAPMLYADQEISIMPNPVKDYCMLDFSTAMAGTIQISVRDMHGMLRQQQKRIVTAGKQHLQLNLQNLQNGIYLLQVRTANNTVLTRKLVVAK